jgi:hypothetical protein
MLAHLVEVQEGVFQSSADGCHSTQRCTLELLALEKGLCIFEEADVIAGDDFDKVLCGGKLTEGDSKMVGVVESVEEILMKGVDILEAREAV